MMHWGFKEAFLDVFFFSVLHRKIIQNKAYCTKKKLQNNILFTKCIKNEIMTSPSLGERFYTEKEKRYGS